MSLWFNFCISQLPVSAFTPSSGRVTLCESHVSETMNLVKLPVGNQETTKGGREGPFTGVPEGGIDQGEVPPPPTFLDPRFCF